MSFLVDRKIVAVAPASASSPFLPEPIRGARSHESQPSSARVAPVRTNDDVEDDAVADDDAVLLLVAGDAAVAAGRASVTRSHLSAQSRGRVAGGGG